jgi:hypothetical protein
MVWIPIPLSISFQSVQARVPQTPPSSVQNCGPSPARDASAAADAERVEPILLPAMIAAVSRVPRHNSRLELEAWNRRGGWRGSGPTLVRAQSPLVRAQDDQVSGLVALSSRIHARFC